MPILERVDDSLSEGHKRACDLFEVIPVAWRRIRETASQNAVSDLMTSIIPGTFVYGDESVRTPFGCAAKALFGPKTQKLKDAGPIKEPASCKAALSGFEPETP